MANFTTETCGNCSNSDSFVLFDPNWENIFSLVVGLFGMVSNFYILAILFVAKIAINEAALVLLKSQVFFDGFAGLFLVLRLFKIELSKMIPVFYIILCYGLTQTMFLWTAFAASAFNIVAVAIQRFAITVFPFRKVTKFSAYITTIVVFLSALGLNLIFYLLEVDVDFTSQKCVYRFESKLAIIIWIVGYYIVPTVAIVFLYAKVGMVLGARSNIRSTGPQNSENIIVKNAVVIAAIFIITNALNTVTVAMSYYDAIDPEFWDRNIRFVSHVSTMFNSASTPIIYVLFLKSVRAKSINVLTCNNYERESGSVYSSGPSVKTQSVSDN